MTTVVTFGAPPGALRMLQASQVTVAFSWASQSSFSALSFASVPPSSYQLLTHGSRGAVLGGSCVSALVGQLLRPYIGLRGLFLISIVFQFLAFVTTLLIPDPEKKTERTEKVEKKVEKVEEKGESETILGEPEMGRSGWLESGRSFLALVEEAVRDTWQAMAVPGVLTWTIWTVVASSVHRIVATYWQNLTIALSPETVVLFNGAFSAAMHLLAATVPLASISLPLTKVQKGIQLGSPVICGALLLVAGNGPLLSTYVSLILYQCVHELTTVTCSTEVGTAMKVAYTNVTSQSMLVRERLSISSHPDRRLALLFSATAAISVVIESVLLSLVLIVYWSSGIPGRFLALGTFLCSLSGILAAPFVFKWFRSLYCFTSKSTLIGNKGDGFGITAPLFTQ